VRTLSGPANKGVNHVVWDMRMDSPLAGIEIPSGRGAAAGAGRGGRGGGGGGGGRGGGGAANGPLVFPGKFGVSLKVPGIDQPLHGEVLVDADPLANLSEAERRTRQADVMAAYDLQRAIGMAQHAVGVLSEQLDSMKASLPAGGSAKTAAHVDSVSSRLSVIQATLTTQSAAAAGVSRLIESFSAPATAEQQREIDLAFADGSKAIEDLNRLIQSEMPGLYSQFSKQAWAKPVKAVPVPTHPR
jgi:hypothetical protein